MARQRAFKKGDPVVLPSGYVRIATRDQYEYRGSKVIDVKDSESETKRVPVKGLKLAELLDEAVVSDVADQNSESELVTNGSEPYRLGKYQRRIQNAEGQAIIVDVYDVLQAFNVTDPALQHLIKKALAPGQRGHKSEEDDLYEIASAAGRALSLYFNRQN